MKALIVEDEKGIREILRIILEEFNFEVDEAPSLTPGKERINGNRYNIILADLRLPDGSGMEIVREVKKNYPETEVVIITAYASAETVKEAIDLGVYDYIEKPFKIEDLRLVVRNIKEKLKLHEQLKNSEIQELIGSSPAMEKLKEAVRKIAPYDVNVLILGESGTGKDVTARAIHNLSQRKNRPFVAINCAALPGELLESELFGYKKGAFTGAVKDKKGLIEQADGGTLFLDEIGDMPLPLQAKLLRFLETRKFRPLGATDEKYVDVRIVAATNKNLREEIERGNFREDLFYRIATITVKVPSLRERKEDIPLLVDYFVKKLSAKYNKKIKRISNSFLKTLKERPLEGNVRELKNIVEREVILAEKGVLGSEYSSTDEFQSKKFSIEIPEEGIKLKELLRNTEKTYLFKALEMADGRKREAAKLLGLTFREFRYRLSKYKK